MSKKLMAVLALFGAIALPTQTSAQGNFLDFGKATAGIIVFGAAACALTSAVTNHGLAICNPHQAQYGRPIQQQQAYLLPPQHPMYVAAPQFGVPPVVTVQGPGGLTKVQTVLGTCLPGQTEVPGSPQNSTCERIGNSLRCRNICQ